VHSLDHQKIYAITSGKKVGLPGEQMGNSEVGHLNLGAGRVVKQDFTQFPRFLCAFFTPTFNKIIKSNRFRTNKTLIEPKPYMNPTKNLIEPKLHEPH
jgi:bisphosphoglycerate-independent phosphoglycerate mutase (AlkP superfamily)